MAPKQALKHILILVGLSYLFFMLGNGILDLTNPDEVFYAQTAKEMAQQKTWTVPYLFGQPQFEKPFLTYWFLRVAFLLFGISNFSARFFPAFFAALGVLVVYGLVLLGYDDKKKAFMAAYVLLSSALYVGLARTVFTDMIFSVLILFSLASFFWAYVRPEKKVSATLLFYIFSALAVLAKGPLGFFIPFFTVFLFLGIRKDLKFLFSATSLGGFLICLLLAVPWYISMVGKFGQSFIREFFYNDHIRRLFEAEHRANDTWYFYPVAMVLCMFPWCFYIAASFFYSLKKIRRETDPFDLFLFCWILVVFVLFQAAHSKLASYIVPLFAPLAILAGDFIDRSLRTVISRLAHIFSFVTLFIFLLIPVGLVVCTFKFSHYIPSKTAVYDFIFFYAAVWVLMLFVILKRKLLAYNYLCGLQVPLLVFFALFSHKDFDVYVSSKKASEYLIKNYAVQDKILCSKFFVRGVRFYTDKEVAVINTKGNNFFSPHPIPYLDTDAKVKEFLRSQPVTYGILAKTALKEIERLSDTGFKVEVLKTIGDEYVVRVQNVS